MSKTAPMHIDRIRRSMRLDPLLAPIAEPCPTCGAAAGAPCLPVPTR